MASTQFVSPSSESTPQAAFRPRNLSRKLIHLILHSSVPIKAQVILAIIVLCSALQSLETVPDTVFSKKNNFINSYFAKFSWAWTLIWLSLTVSIMGALYSALKVEVLLRHLGRVAVGHVIWFSVTSLIELLDNYTGVCTEKGVLSAKMCRRGGHAWTGFDISGHIFLLSYCVFMVTEEAANIKLEVWDGYEKDTLLEHQVVAKMEPGRKRWLMKVYCTANYFVEALELYALALVLLWMSIIVASSLYFHTFFEKLLGCALAVLVWCVTYRFGYGSCHYLPCETSYGVLHPKSRGQQRN